MTTTPQEWVLVPPSPDEQAQINQVSLQAAQARTPEETAHVIAHALLIYRQYVIRTGGVYLLPQVAQAARLAGMFDFVWLAFSSYFKDMLRPVVSAYMLREAFRGAKATLPDAVALQLADEYVDRMGQYFNHTSAAALEQGFNAYVNRKVAPRVALERVLQAFGLTERQMAALVAQPDSDKVTGVQRLDPRRKAKEFIGKQIRSRVKLIAEQESFTISQEALQVGWLWQAKTGRIPQTAKKIWITARDEKVCKLCGPMHMQAVDVTEHFTDPNGGKHWVTGVHVNCRCTMRLSIPTTEFGKAQAFDERKHRRDRSGRFAEKPDELDYSAVRRAQSTEKTTEETPLAAPLAGLAQNALAGQTLASDTLAGGLAPQDLKLAMEEEQLQLAGQDAPLTLATPQQRKQALAQHQENVQLFVEAAFQIADEEQMEKPTPGFDPVDFGEPLYAKLTHAVPEINPRTLEITGMRLGEEDKFGTKWDMVDQLNEDFMNHAADRAEEIVYMGKNKITADTVPESHYKGETYHAELDEETIQWAIMSADTNFEADYADLQQEVAYYKNDGDYAFTLPMSYREMAQKLKIEPEPLEGTVYRMRYGVPSAFTSHLQSGTKNAAEEYIAPGTYDAEEIMDFDSNLGFSIRIIDLSPRDAD